MTTPPDAEHSRSGWCSTGRHEGCKARPNVARICGCFCHDDEGGE